VVQPRFVDGRDSLIGGDASRNHHKLDRQVTTPRTVIF